MLPRTTISWFQITGHVTKACLLRLYMQKQWQKKLHCPLFFQNVHKICWSRIKITSRELPERRQPVWGAQANCTSNRCSRNLAIMSSISARNEIKKLLDLHLASLRNTRLGPFSEFSWCFSDRRVIMSKLSARNSNFGTSLTNSTRNPRWY